MINFLPTTTSNLSELEKYVKEINALETKIQTLEDFQIKEESKKLLKQYQIEQNLDNLLIKSFALTREASKRTIGLRHYDNQIIGGIALHQGKVAEMKTGEGKTLVATLPVSLNAISLKGVHVVTPNEYLARRDQQLMSPLYRFLGFSVGLVQEGMGFTTRKKNYATDITYLTNTELAFDYLRDHMATIEKQVVQRPFNFCIVDEVDSILIDESRTPLIISGPSYENMSKYQIANHLVGYLKSGEHFEVNEKAKTVTLTTRGFSQLKTLLQINGLYNDQDPWIQYVLNALKAKSLYKKNINYIVYENKIYIVDEFTGRVLQNRQWGEGLHQAVQAKEFLKIDSRSETYASITYQNFFNLYPKLAGMTGTAKTEEVELDKIFDLEVITIPTTKPLIRRDLLDEIYINEFQKWKAIIKECETVFATGCPILIGTTSIEKSEIISRLLTEKKIPHKLLNAKPESIKKESEIIAQAGCLYSVTVATNLAGRGTDILLGGNPDLKARRCVLNFVKHIKQQDVFGNALTFSFLSKSNVDKSSNKKFLKFIQKFDTKTFKENLLVLSYLDNSDIGKILRNIINNGYTDKNEPIYLFIKELYEYFLQQCKKKSDSEKALVQKLGGLYIIGTERHESQRVDNQLRGRAGRQGDPGLSKFFVSLDDPLFKIFGNIPTPKEEFSNSLNLSSVFGKQLNTVQKKVESYYYESRKNVFDFDKILDSQRKLLFTERQKVLDYKTVRPDLIYYGEELICSLVFDLKKLINDNNINSNSKSFKKLMKEISLLLQVPYFLLNYEDIKSKSKEELCYIFIRYFWLRYDLRELQLQRYGMYLSEVEKIIFLTRVNKFWKLHLQNIELLQECVVWRTYARLNSLSEYENEAFYLFVATIYNIKYNAITDILLTSF